MSESDACPKGEFADEQALPGQADAADWSGAVANGSAAAPAGAERFRITNLQHWLDLCA
jgi:hypothetical protein